MGIAKEKQEIKEMNIVTDKEKKIYFKYPMSIDELKDEKDIESLLYKGIKVNRPTLSGRIEELGMLENLRKYRPDILQAYLGGREFDPIDMGAEADLKRLLAEYSTNKGADITCILEVPKDCKYVNNIKSLQPTFIARLSDGQILIPSQFIKALVTKEDTGYHLWKGPNYNSRFSVKKGLLEEKELNRIVHNINPAATKISSVTAAKKAFTVKWAKKTTQTTGYQICYGTSTNKDNCKKVLITSNATVSKKFTGLTSGKTYNVWVRTYKTVNGTKYYSTWSEKKTAKVK